MWPRPYIELIFISQGQKGRKEFGLDPDHPEPEPSFPGFGIMSSIEYSQSQMSERTETEQESDYNPLVTGESLQAHADSEGPDLSAVGKGVVLHPATPPPSPKIVQEQPRRHN